MSLTHLGAPNPVSLLSLLDDFTPYRHHHPSTHLASFTPKFDVRELPTAYELHGDLPGIAQKDIDIEFQDAQTLSIRGRTQREYTAGTPPEQGRVTSAETPPPGKGKAAEEEQQQEQQQQQGKYWVSERAVGEFARSFHFPTRVEQDKVKARMRDGVLTIEVPKVLGEGERKRIAIS